jgi:iron(III) transport system permease protein
VALTSRNETSAVESGPPSVEPPQVPRGSLRSLMTRYGGSATWWIFVTALGFVVLAPVAVFYARALENGAEPVRNLPDIPGIGKTLLVTLELAAGSTIIAVVLAVALATLVMRVPLRYRGIAAFIPQLPLVIPPVAMIVGWIFIFAPTIGYGNTLLRGLPFIEVREGPIDIYSMAGIMIITGLDLTGIVFAFVYARMHEISGSLEAAARLSGASALRAFSTVTLPLLRPSLVAATVVSFLLGLGQFTAPLLLGSAAGIEVLATEIFRVRERFPIDYGATAAIGLPLLVVGLISIVVQRAVVGDQRRYVTQGAGGGVAKKDSRWALTAIFGYGAVTVLVPVIGLVLVAFSPYWNGDLSTLTLTSKHVSTTLENPEVLDSIVNSATTSLLAALVVLPLGFIAALGMSGVVKAPRPVQYLLDLIFVAPLAVPRALLGMAVLYVFLRPPFGIYGTFALFVVGYAFIVLPFSVRSQYASLVGVPSAVFEASRVCGAGQLRTLWSIALPLTKRGIAAALAIMVVLLSHDFAVSVMLRSPGNHVMGTLIYEFWETGVFPQVAVMALVMTVVTGVLLAITIRIGGRAALENL